MYRLMQKGNKGKLRAGTANKTTIGLGGPRRRRNDELRPWVFNFFAFYFARSVFTFGLGFPTLRFSHLRFIFKLKESLIEMEILRRHSFLRLFILHRSKCGNCDISPHVRESGIRNPTFFCLWNPESWALESGIQSLESGIQPHP